MEKEQTFEDIFSKFKNHDKKQIVIYNDDVNSFQWVIQSLIEVCEHDPFQAEQCANIIHYNGKCDVKSGSFEELKPLTLELLNRQLSAKIE